MDNSPVKTTRSTTDTHMGRLPGRVHPSSAADAAHRTAAVA